MFDVNKIEAALAAEKEEIDRLTGKLTAVRDSAKELKPLVLKYTELRHEEKDINRSIHTKTRDLKIKLSLFDSAGGDAYSIFPLFQTQPEATTKFVELNKAGVD